MSRRKRHAVILGLTLSALGTRWAYAKTHSALEEGGMSVARGLHEAASVLSRLELPASPRENGSRHLLSINGALLRLESTWLSDPDGSLLSTILERGRTDCRRPIRPDKTTSGTVLEAPLLEQELPREGFVFCLKPLSEFSLEGMKRAADEFSETGDLSSFGRFQGVYVRRGASSTLVLTVEVLEGLSPGIMFPTEGDGPGSDIEQLPRPVGRRLLSIGYARASALTNYVSVDSPDKALETYERALKEQGVNTHRRGADSRALLAQSSDDTFIVSTAPATQGTILTIARLPE